jgi:murein DD-endopeptidase MepM/ murein hydrolase activator NlpD
LRHGWITAGEQLLARCAQTLAHHPKHVTALLATVLLGGGGGAYAVAALGPDPALLPVTELVQEVAPLPLAVQSEALQAHSFNLYRSEVTRSSDTIDSLLGRLGINDPVAAAYLRSHPVVRIELLGRAGRHVTAEANAQHGLVTLKARWTAEDPRQFRRLVVHRNEMGRFAAWVENAPLEPSLRLGSGTLQTSLFAAVDDAGIPDEVALQLVDIFAGEIDFHRGLRRGDRFHVVYETLEADGEPLRTGRVMSVEFRNAGRTLQAVWFQEPGKPGGYYSLDGQSLERAYLASPMQVSRVTSGFAMRMHPIHQVWRQHLGVDYGAPTGTPVRSVGQGKVDFAGSMGGYGNVVIIDHGRGETTLYGHLSRIDVRMGQVVARGQNLGAVGSTGWATGPHLHFEFRDNGVHKDPQLVARRSQGLELSAAARPAFQAAVRSMRLQLEAANAAGTATFALAR